MKVKVTYNHTIKSLPSWFVFIMCVWRPEADSRCLPFIVTGSLSESGVHL